jgi:hypothetical protein
VTALPCGTNTAYARHIRAGEPTDPACREAHNAYQREHYALRRRVSEARLQALEALSYLHPQEYAALYAAAIRETGGAR